MPLWRPKYWIWLNKRSVTDSWSEAQTRQPKRWIVIWPIWSFWPPMRRRWRSFCICHCCAKTRTCRTSSFDRCMVSDRPFFLFIGSSVLITNLHILSSVPDFQHWPERAAWPGKWSRVPSPRTRARNWSRKFKNFRTRSRSCWSKSPALTLARSTLLKSILRWEPHSTGRWALVFYFFKSVFL